MVRPSIPGRMWWALTAVLAAAVIVLVATRPSSSSSSHTQSGSAGRVAAAYPAFGSPALATYSEEAPHVSSALNAYGLQGQVRGEAPAPPESLTPVPAADFNAPVATYLAYSSRQLGLMETQISSLEGALAVGDRTGAENAWRGAFSDYLKLGAVYLEGQVARLDQAIDGTPGGLAGGTSSAKFSGLHRLEFGLWTGQPLSLLEPWAHQLAADVSRLRHALPHVQISPLDYATRAHEILEDAIRDLLSGTDVPWSGEGVLGTDAGVTATSEVIDTLAPLLTNREGTLPIVVDELGGLRSTLSTIIGEHGGSVPTNGELTQSQSEQLDASLGQALEALAQVPGTLETTRTPQIPQIPPAADRPAQ